PAQLDGQETELVACRAAGKSPGETDVLHFRDLHGRGVHECGRGAPEGLEVGVERTGSQSLRRKCAKQQEILQLHGAPPLSVEVFLSGFRPRALPLAPRAALARTFCHTTNCSLRIRSSRLCSGSNNSVTVRSRDSRITTSTTSRVSWESAVTLTGRLYGSSTSNRTSVSALRIAPRQRRGRNAAIGVSAMVCDPSGRIGPCAEKLYAVLPAGVATITPSQISSSRRCWPLRSMRMCAAWRVCRSSDTSL